MSTATTTDTGQTTSHRTTTPTTNTPATQTERSAANRLRSTMAAVRLAFTWLGVRKTLAPEQRTTAARAFQADRDLLSATKLILDTKHPSFRNVARVRSEASGYWRAETLPFPEPGVRLLPQNKLTGFDARMSQFRQELLDAARELSGQYEQIKSEAQRRLGSLFNPGDYPTTLDGMFDLEVSYPPIEPPSGISSLIGPGGTSFVAVRREREHERADRDGAGRRRGWWREVHRRRDLGPAGTREPADHPGEPRGAGLGRRLVGRHGAC